MRIALGLEPSPTKSGPPRSLTSFLPDHRASKPSRLSGTTIDIAPTFQAVSLGFRTSRNMKALGFLAYQDLYNETRSSPGFAFSIAGSPALISANSFRSSVLASLNLNFEPR